MSNQVLTIRPETSKPDAAWLFPAAVAVATTVLAAIALLGAPAVLQGGLVDSDSYLRLHRVLRVHEGGAWFDSFEPAINAPVGQHVNWTAPLDLLLMAGVWIGGIFTDARDALFGWGVIVSPVLLAVTLALLRWGTRPYIGPPAFLLMTALVFFQPQLAWVFGFGRPDHHSLMALLFAGQLAALLRLGAGASGTGAAALAGACAGLALWVSVESLLAVAFGGGGLALLWILGGPPQPRFLAAYFTAAAAVALVAAGLEDTAADWLLYARFSRVHALFVSLAALAWLAILAFAARRPSLAATPARRFAAGLAAALFCGLVMLSVYPRFFGGPMMALDPSIVVWMEQTNREMQPLLPSSPARAARFLLQLTPALLASAYMVYALRRDDRRRHVWLAILLGLLLYLPASLYQERWASYVQLLALLPWTLALLALLRAARRVPGTLFRAPATALAASAGVAGHIALAAALLPPAGEPGAPSGCDWRQVAPSLKAAAGGEAILLSYLYAGPELLWRTGLPVVGAPYMDATSLKDTDAVLGATDPDAARKVVVRRGVDLVLVARCSIEGPQYADGTMHARLLRGAAPEWLDRVPLPAGLGESYALYRVSKPN